MPARRWRGSCAHACTSPIRAHFDGFARAHGEAFADIRPANTTVFASLYDPAWKVEIDVDAVLP